MSGTPASERSPSRVTTRMSLVATLLAATALTAAVVAPPATATASRGRVVPRAATGAVGIPGHHPTGNHTNGGVASCC